MKGYLGIRLRLFLLLTVFFVLILTVHSFVLLSLTKRHEVDGTVLLSQQLEREVAKSSVVLSIGEKYRKHWQLAAVFIAVNALIFTVVLFFRLDNILIRPLEKLGGLAEQYRDDELAITGVDFPAQGPFHSLAHTLRQMLERIELDRKRLQGQVVELEEANEELLLSRKQLVRSEKLATVGRLSAGLAHEIGNPLAIVQGYLELLQDDDLSVQERRQYVEISNTELKRVGRLIGDLLQFSRADNPILEEVVVADFLQECCDLAAMHAAVRCCQLRLDIAEVANRLLSTSPDSLRQVILNLLLNAADSLQEQGEEERWITLSGSIDHDNIEIVVRDNGAGVTPEIEHRLFEPFFTTKESGKGTGLGLFVSQLLIERLGGDISAGNLSDGEGFAVRVVLPLA